MAVAGFKTEIKRLGARIKAIRKKRGMKLLELQAATGIAKSTLSRYENGRYPNVELYTLFLISKALDVTTSQMTDYDAPIPGDETKRS